MNAVHDRIGGAMLAHAAGDALGATLEFMTADAVVAKHGVLKDIIGGGAFNWRPGQGTDDTDLSLITCDSYADHGRLDIDDIGNRLINWADSRPPDIGNTTRVGIANYRRHRDASRSGPTDNRTAGNGSLMRALAPGLVVTDERQRGDDAARLSAITHGSTDCRAACIAYADIVHHLLNGAEPADAIGYALNRTLTVEVADALGNAPQGLASVANAAHGWVIHSLRTAVAGLIDAEREGLETTLISIANRGGDADTNAAIAGGLLGARQGAAAVPDRWVNRLEQRTRITNLAAQFAGHRATPTTGQH